MRGAQTTHTYSHVLTQDFRRRYLLVSHLTPWVTYARARARKRANKQSALSWRSSTLRLEGLRTWLQCAKVRQDKRVDHYHAQVRNEISPTMLNMPVTPVQTGPFLPCFILNRLLVTHQILMLFKFALICTRGM